MLMVLALVILAVVSAAGLLFLLLSLLLAAVFAVVSLVLASFSRTRAIGLAFVLSGILSTTISVSVYVIALSLLFHSHARLAGAIVAAILGFAWLGSTAAVLSAVSIFLVNLSRRRSRLFRSPEFVSGLTAARD